MLIKDITRMNAFPVSPALQVLANSLNYQSDDNSNLVNEVADRYANDLVGTLLFFDESADSGYLNDKSFVIDFELPKKKNGVPEANLYLFSGSIYIDKALENEEFEEEVQELMEQGATFFALHFDELIDNIFSSTSNLAKQNGYSNLKVNLHVNPHTEAYFSITFKI